MYDPGTLYSDPILTNLSVGFQDQTLYGREIFPETPVRTQSGRYRVYDRSSWLIHESRREPGAVANEILGAKWSEDVFETQEHSLQAPVFDEERQALTSQGGLAQAVFGGDLQIDPERDATNLVTGSIMRAHELKVANTVRNAANYPGANTVTLAGAQQWDDYTNGVTSTSNPVADIQKAIRTIYAATGRYPNTMVIPRLAAVYLENHPRVVDRFKMFNLTDPEAWRTLSGFAGRVLLVDSVYNAANHIDLSESIASYWGKDVWLGVVDNTPGQRTKTFGKTFAQVYPDGTLRPTDRWREEPRKADIVRTSYKYDLKIVSSSAGYLIKNAVSAGAF
jgi:hypothetical protein